MFTLNKTLENDSLLLGREGFCQLRLINDARFPWVLIVPEQEDLRELQDMAPARLLERNGAGLPRRRGHERGVRSRQS